MLHNLRVQAQADPARRWMSSIWLAVVVGCVYILSARMSLALLTPEGVAVFWPAAGVAAGALIAFGPRARWAVVAGTMVATIVERGLSHRGLPLKRKFRPRCWVSRRNVHRAQDEAW